MTTIYLINSNTGTIQTEKEWRYDFSNTEAELWGGDNFEDAELIEVEQHVTGIGIADFCEDGTTVYVEVEITAGSDFVQSETFYVQTVDGEYRSDLGCWITSQSSDGDINKEDFPGFYFYEIIKEAQEYMCDERDETYTGYYKNGENIYIVKQNNEFIVVTRDSNFINSDTNSYHREFSDAIDSFETKEEAVKYVEEEFTKVFEHSFEEDGEE